MTLLRNKDFWAGMMLLGIGVAALFFAQDYRFSSSQSIDPSFFPKVLGMILILFGICVVVMGLRKSEKIEGKWSPRALILLPLSLVLFGVLMQHGGLIPALMVLIFGSAAAGKEFKIVETLLVTVLLTAFSAALFVWGLDLPYPLIKGF